MPERGRRHNNPACSVKPNPKRDDSRWYRREFDEGIRYDHRMSTPRLLAVLLFALIAAAPASAQPAIAPAPHATLNSIVQEYQRLELPVPPKEAELVRFKRTFSNEFADEPDRVDYWVGFRTPRASRFERPKYFVGTGSGKKLEFLFADECESAKPTAAAIDGVVPDFYYLLPFAVQCKLRGWDELGSVESSFAIPYTIRIYDRINHPGSLPQIL